jgi:hypothetical protein
MTNKKLNFPKKISGSLLILALFSQFVLADTSYDLPSSKQYLELCAREALALHQGDIEQERVLHQQNRFEVRYEIQATDGSEWSVLCDLQTGKVIGEQKLLGSK